MQKRVRQILMLAVVLFSADGGSLCAGTITRAEFFQPDSEKCSSFAARENVAVSPEMMLQIKRTTGSNHAVGAHQAPLLVSPSSLEQESRVTAESAKRHGTRVPLKVPLQPDAPLGGGNAEGMGTVPAPTDREQQSALHTWPINSAQELTLTVSIQATQSALDPVCDGIFRPPRVQSHYLPVFVEFAPSWRSPDKWR